MIEEPISGIRDADLFSQMLYVHLFYRTNRGFFEFLQGTECPVIMGPAQQFGCPSHGIHIQRLFDPGQIFPLKDWSDRGIPDPVHISFTNCVESGMEPGCCLFHREHADILRQILIHIGTDILRRSVCLAPKTDYLPCCVNTRIGSA